jgi:hypothetical protein
MQFDIKILCDRYVRVAVDAKIVGIPEVVFVQSSTKIDLDDWYEIYGFYGMWIGIATIALLISGSVFYGIVHTLEKFQYSFLLITGAVASIIILIIVIISKSFKR